MRPRLTILTACLLCLAAGGLRAQPALPAADAPAPALASAPVLSADEADGGYDIWGRFQPRAAYRYEAFNSIGRQGGLSSFQAFLPFWETDASDALAFLDARFLLFDQATPGTNVNLGYRTLLPGINRTLGGHVAYDLTDTSTSTFHQVSGGLESFGSWLDARANFYAPLGRQRRLLGSSFTGNTDALFQGQYLMFGGGSQTNFYESALTGFDTEVGGNVVQFGRVNLRAFVGTYYFGVDNGPDTWGARGRVEARVSDTVALALSVQKDRLFDTTVNLHVTLSWPTLTGRRREDVTDYTLRPADRLGESVERIQQVVVARNTDTVVVPRQAAIDPLTGQPLVFLHVAPGGHSDGSFENPYGSLKEAFADPRFAAGNVVVYDRTLGTYSGNVFLAPGTRLLSAGPAQYVDTLNAGRLLLPFSGASTGLTALPHIQGTVTMSSNTTLSGYNVSNNGGADLVNQAPGVVRNVRVDSNVLTGGNMAVNLNNVAGNVDVVNNRIQNPSMHGVNVQVENDETASIRITDNRIGGSGLGGVYMTVNDVMGLSANVNAAIERNAITGAGAAGVSLGAAGNSQLTASVRGNQISGATGSGVEVLASPGNAVTRADISGNTVSGSGSAGTAGIFLSGQSPAGLPALIARVYGNTLTGNFTAGVSAISAPFNSLALDMKGNTASGTQGGSDFAVTGLGGKLGVVDLANLGAANAGTLNVSGGPANLPSLP